jgi:hypothetical protein
MQTLTTESTSPVAYPPTPWRINGQIYGSTWVVPAADFRAELSPAFEPVIVRGKIYVFAGFVHYQEGSVLTYHELMVGLLMRLKDPRRYAATVTHIWVDNEISKWGGRELWGLPKELAEFQFDYQSDNRHFEAQAQAGGVTLATGNFQAKFGLPRNLRLPLPIPSYQMLRGQPHFAFGTLWGRLHYCQGGLQIPPESPLAALGLAGRKPLLSFAGLDFKANLQAAKPLKQR